MNNIDIRIEPDHPSAAGHFPGNPIVPGAVLLSEVFAAWQHISGNVDQAITLRNAKFINPTRPGDHVKIDFDVAPNGSVKFTCSVAEIIVVTGTLAPTP